MIGGKLNLDGNMLPYDCNTFASFNNKYFEGNYIKTNLDHYFNDLSFIYHSFIFDYQPGNDCFDVYDLNKPNYKLTIYQYPVETISSSETFFNIIVCDFVNEYYAVATQTGHIFDSFKSCEIKYLVIGFISTDIYNSCDKFHKSKTTKDIENDFLIKISYNPTNIDYNKLKEVLMVSS